MLRVRQCCVSSISSACIVPSSAACARSNADRRAPSASSALSACVRAADRVLHSGRRHRRAAALLPVARRRHSVPGAGRVAQLLRHGADGAAEAWQGLGNHADRLRVGRALDAGAGAARARAAGPAGVAGERGHGRHERRGGRGALQDDGRAGRCLHRGRLDAPQRLQRVQRQDHKDDAARVGVAIGQADPLPGPASRRAAAGLRRRLEQRRDPRRGQARGLRHLRTQARRLLE
eukprot:3464114-Pleurochrysis_carterae.AAC.2